jgi:hypothetical protein
MKNLFPSHLLLAFSIMLLCLPACRQNGPIKQTDGTIPADFEAFYKKFHSDSVYQMAHIRFPLAGVPSNVDTSTPIPPNFHWEAAEWRMHRPLEDKDPSFERSLSMVIPDFVEEKIHQKQTPYSMLRRFHKDGNEWFLIYYVDMNPF